MFHCRRYNTTGRGMDSTVSRRVIESYFPWVGAEGTLGAAIGNLVASHARASSG